MTSATTPTLTDIIQVGIESYLRDIHTGDVGKIVSYDPATQTADILPMTRQPMPDGEGGVKNLDLPILPNVPIAWPRGGGYSLTFPLAPGDFVTFFVTTNAIGQYRESGNVSDPGDTRTHSLGSCIAFPGVWPNSQALPSALAGAPACVIAGPDVRLGDETASEAVVTTGKLLAVLQAIFTTPGAGTEAGYTAAKGVVAAYTDLTFAAAAGATKVKAK